MMSSLTLGSLFTGRLVRLTAPRPDDKEALARWSLDAEYSRQMMFRPAMPQPPDHFEEKKEDHKDRNRFIFMFRTLTDDTLIGVAGIRPRWSNQTASVWIGIGEAAYRSKGYGTDAMRLLVSYGFRELGLYRISLTVFGYNTRAIHVYEKIGFVHEGTLRAALYRDSQRWDLHGMSILRPEWEARQASFVAEFVSEPALEAQPGD